jgi:16S rRNA (guanine966-N2)-methyltransferase
MSPEIRIGGGCYKGRPISSFAGNYRPTAAIVKKSLFDTLGDDIDDSRFLDLFAGCGAVGLEAISRDAGFVCFVDNNAARVAALRKNLQRLEVPREAWEIIAADFSSALHLLRERSARFDFIYVDPPYNEMVPRRILGDLVTSNALADDGLIIFEASKQSAGSVAQSTPEELYPIRERMLGGTALIFFRWRASR